MRTAAALLAAGVLVGADPAAAGSDDPVAERLKMVRKIVEYRPYRDALKPEVMSERVLEAMRGVERHLFVPEKVRSMAYDDTPLPIGYGQTISQPFIVALMTHLLAPKPGRRGARDRHRLGLSGGGAVAVGEQGLHHRDHPRPRPRRGRAAGCAGLRQCRGPDRRRLSRLAGLRPVRRHRRHCRRPWLRSSSPASAW